jgi:leader peptidase (prepilin peptidase)/N-methyltransferase
VSAPTWPLLALPGLVAGIAARTVVWYLAVERPPRRACPACARPPRHALVPVRPLTGRCPRCGGAVFPPLLVPEVLGAAGFALAGWVGGGGLRVAAVCWLVAFALPAVLVDAAVQRLPDLLTWPCLAGVLALCLGQAAVDGAVRTLVRTALAVVVVAAVFLVLALVADLGLADVKLAAPLAAVLGYGSWSAVLAGLAAGFAIAGLYALAAAVLAGHKISARMPLGPALLCGTMLGLASTAR